jgi:3-oxoacyl-[acyl-carrier-protein] synthase III
VELIGRRLGIVSENYHVSLAEHGNLIAASIPYALHRAGARLPTGTRTMLLGTAAGYSQAAMIFTR